MSTNYIAPIWRMPRNANKDKLSNYNIDFNGSSEYINFGTDLFTDSTIPSISISVWIKTSAAGAIMSKDIATSSNRNFLFQIAGTQLYWQTSTDGNSFDSLIVPQSTFDVIDSQWHHIVVTYNAGTSSGDGEKKIYIDGSEIADSPLATYAEIYNTSSVPIEIGRRGDGTRYFYDNMSQACIFNYALSSSQVSYLYNLNNPMAITGGEPVAYWPLGDNSNPNAPGSFPNISTGTDSVFNFNGSNESIRITDTGKAPTALQSIGNENSYTVAGWINTTSTSTGGGSWFSNDTFIDFRQQQGSGAHVPFSIGMDNGEVSFGRSPNYTGSAEKFKSTGTINDGNWHHIAFTVNVNSLKIYIDGSLDSSHTFTVAIGNCSVGTTNSNFQLGARSTDTGGLTSFAAGDYSNFQIWDTELIDTEVNELYNNGQPLMSGTQPQEANLQAWYKLNQTANWEADVAGDWQVPDNRSAYTQSFTFLSPTSVNSPGYYNFTGDFTVSVWAKAHSIIASTYGMIFAIGSPGFSPPAGPGAYFAFQKSNLKFIWDDSSSGVYRSSNNTFQYEEWVHIVLVKEGSASNNLQMYINGQADPLTGTSTAGVQGQLTLGRWLGSTSFRLDGNISNFQFWDTALSAAQALTLYNDGTPLTSAIETENLQGWWKLDGTSTWNGSEWEFADLSGNAQTLTSSGMNEQNLANDNVSGLNAQSSGMATTNLVQSNLTRTQPYSNYSMNFDGTNYFDLGGLQGTALQPSDATLISDGFSVSAWINIDDDTSFRTIWQNDGLGSANYYGLIFLINGPSTSPVIPFGRINIGYGDGGAAGSGSRLNYITTSPVITSTNTWYHVVAIFKGMGTSTVPVAQGLYVNGVEITAFNSPTGTGVGLAYSPSAKGSIGVGRNVIQPMDGEISNCACFNRTLTQDEVLKIYNNGVPQDLQTASSFSNNLVAWWPMDQRSSYYDGTNLVIRDLENGNDGDGQNTDKHNIIGNAPRSDANGEGSNLTIADLKGDMYNSDKNAYSINMGDYADGVTNPADSGRSTNIPSV